jgi:3-polyprenyl-4-hydroxybenzoate decarboxylase
VALTPLHGVGGAVLVGMVVIHIYFALRPEKLRIAATLATTAAAGTCSRASDPDSSSTLASSSTSATAVAPRSMRAVAQAALGLA